MWDNPDFNGMMIASVVMNEGVMSIGESAFSHKPYLESVSIPNTVVSIGDDAFFRCEYLASITIPNSVTTIGAYAFYYTGIESLTLGNSLFSMGESAFNNCHLKALVIPNSLKTIPESAFHSCIQLESVDFGDSLVSIGKSAFSLCTALTDIDFPNTLKSIGESAFWDCYSLQSVNFPDSLESIGADAFVLCVSLNSIRFPNSSSLTSIGENAFGMCNDIREVYCMAATPPQCEDDNTFSGAVYYATPLYVPIGCKLLYENASGWKMFANIVETGDVTDENPGANFFVFPNPSSDYIHIEFSPDVNPQLVEIYSLDGKMAASHDFNLGTINVASIPTGVYLMKITVDDGNVVTERVVIIC